MRNYKKTLSRITPIVLIICLLIIVIFILLYGVGYYCPVVSIVDEVAIQVGVSAELILSVMRAESHFDYMAKSSKGALGLMQLMPSTAVWIAQKIDMVDYELLTARDNIMLGSAYLRYLLDKFCDTRLAIMAYNAGEGNVDIWRSLAENDIFDSPYLETNNYIKRVMSNYKVYCILR